MQKRRRAVLATTCAVAVVSAMTYVSAQRGSGPRSEPDRHLVYIATPGDGGTDNQSGIVVLDADKNYSWIAMANDGKLALIGDSSIIDVKTHKEIAVLKDEYGRRIVHTEKALFMTFKDGKLIETNNQFAVGDAKAYAARMAAGTR